MNEQDLKQTGRVLIVDDDPIVAESLGALLVRDGHTTATAHDGAEAMTLIRDAAEPFQVVLTDINMPRSDGTELLKNIRKNHPALVVLMITGYGTIESAVSALKLGAFDYLTKPIIDEEVRAAVGKALVQHQLLAENTRLKDRLGERFALSNIVGGDHKMQKVFDVIEAVADSRTTVLINGESGTGKSMIASAIHERSARHDGPFVTMACGSIPETLLESELFGHIKGSFTGADRDKVGKLQAADGGTLFIDEINSATAALQLKLLRVLQEKRFEPIGSNQTIEVDVRFVLATNQSLEALVQEGGFREDLYYRINVVNVELPPLRQREGDVPLLVEHFLKRYCRETGKVITGFSDEAMAALRRYRWPGNVRELENAVERAVVLSRTPVIDLDVLPDKVAYQTPDGQPGFRERRKNPQGWSASTWRGEPLRDALCEPERQIILAALTAHDWNRQQTAEALDINRTTLYKKIKQYGLEELAATR